MAWSLAVTDTDLATYDEMQNWNVGTLVLCTGKTEAEVREEFPDIPFVLKPCCAEDFDRILREQNDRASERTFASPASVTP